ncbi:acyl-CoA N-acyltransferase [Mariannaea sp. PMI_226]|nr:acyl-CoA N-acyltransferase [Mariannaea sp. PMI_226]
MSLSFRKATPADASSILALVRSAYRGDSSRTGWTTEADLVADDRIDTAGVIAKISEPRGAIILAFAKDSDSGEGQGQGEGGEGTLISCCEVLCRSDDVSYFGLFAVDPTKQAGGIGRKVLQHAEAFAKAEFGARMMEMWVIWTREELIAWYIRRGYRKTSKTSPFPYAQLVNGKALRDDLYFITLEKDL